MPVPPGVLNRFGWLRTRLQCHGAEARASQIGSRVVSGVDLYSIVKELVGTAGRNIPRAGPRNGAGARRGGRARTGGSALLTARTAKRVGDYGAETAKRFGDCELR